MTVPIPHRYQAWPEPRVPFLAGVRRDRVWQLAAEYVFDRCGLGAPSRPPRIWITGCGTLQPYVIRLANPTAEVVATDAHGGTLRAAERRCLWHGQYGVRFARADLADEATWPAGTFDWIECRGTLPTVGDPAAVLRGLAARLRSPGVIRATVPPYFTRRRQAQLRRIAELLGLRADRPHHRSILRDAVHRLPAAHPLRRETGAGGAFGTDGVSEERAPTGLELGAWIDGAGLRPAWWFHPPWADPVAMAGELELGDTSQSFVLHYLDLWQELRSDFVACLARSDDAPRLVPELYAHPLFDLRQAGSIPDALRRIAQRFLGVQLSSATDGEPVEVGSDELRLLRRLARNRDYDPAATERLREIGMLLGGVPRATPALPPHATLRAPGREPAPLLRGARVPNPLYAHLFAAWEFAGERSGGVLPDLLTQLRRWRAAANPLETPSAPIGLTPFGTFRERSAEIERYLAAPATATGDDWASWPLRDGEARRRAVERWLASVPHLPRRSWPPAELSELWVLLLSPDVLFLTAE